MKKNDISGAYNTHKNEDKNIACEILVETLDEKRPLGTCRIMIQ
jgi:hypothetical protein